jgi:hypothetical protein
LQNVARHRVRATTFATYRKQLRLVDEGLGSIPARELRPEQIAKFVSDLIDRGSASRARNIRTLLVQVMDQAVELGLATENVAKRVKTPKVPRVERRTVTPDGSSDPTMTILERIAAASGRQLTIDSAAPTETSTAGLVGRLGIDQDGEPDWTTIRAFADWADQHPEDALDSIVSPPMRTESDRIDNLIAAIAETIADVHGGEPPRWCSAVEALEHPWMAPGTPAMRKRHAPDIPPRFADRNIRLAVDTVWRQGTLANP